MARNLGTLADMVDDNIAAALDFNDVKSAEETLSALKAEPPIIGACVYTKKWTRFFAKYHLRTNEGIAFEPPALATNMYRFLMGGGFSGVPSHCLQRESIGAVYLESDMRALYSRLTRYAGIVGLVFLASLLFAFILSSRLQRLISEPILHLAQVVRSVAEEKNYAVRAKKRSDDELGDLIDGFNDMLGQIQQRDAALLSAQSDLEARVVGRTAELAKSNQALQTENAERKRIEGVLQQRATLAALEADVGTALTKGGTLAEMLGQCCEAIVRRLDGAFARVWTLNEKDNVLELQASAGLHTHFNGPHGRVPVGQFKIGLIAEEKKPHLTNQVVGDPRVGDQEWARREGMVAFAGYPLLLEDRVVGVVATFARHTLGETTLQAMASISNSIAMGIEQKRAVEELRDSEEKFRQLAENISDVFWMTSPDLQQVLYVSPAYERVWGRSARKRM